MEGVWLTQIYVENSHLNNNNNTKIYNAHL